MLLVLVPGALITVSVWVVFDCKAFAHIFFPGTNILNAFGVCVGALALSFAIQKLANVFAAFRVVVNSLAGAFVFKKLTDVLARVVFVKSALAVHEAIAPLAFVALTIGKQVGSMAMLQSFLVLCSFVNARFKFNFVNQMLIVKQADVVWQHGLADVFLLSF